MKTFIFLYNETSFFETVFVAYFMKTVGDVYIVTEKNIDYVTINEGIKVVSDVHIEDVNVMDIDVFIVCGGETSNILDIEKLQNIIKKCNAKKKILGGICAGSKIVMDALDIELEILSTTQIGENIILSPGNEFIDFALKVGRIANIYINEEDYLETVNYFKYFKNIE